MEPRVREARAWLIVSDYDGTLTPIASRPERARLAPGARRLLRRLASADGLRVGIVTGRSLGVIRRLVKLPGIIYVGNHGLEISGPGLRFAHPEARRSRPTMRRTARRLRRELRGLRGALIEEKGLSLSVHWRRVDQADVARFHRQVRRVLAVLVARGAVRVTRGKCVLEVRPQTRWDKGSAVAWLDRRCDTRGRVLYLGDDRTDEDAFRAANRLGGISIAVGTRPGRTAARWWLPGPRDVGKLLSLILDVRCRKRSKR